MIREIQVKIIIEKLTRSRGKTICTNLSIKSFLPLSFVFKKFLEKKIDEKRTEESKAILLRSEAEESLTEI